MSVSWIIYAQINYGRIRWQSQLFNFNYVCLKIRPKKPPSHWLDDGSDGSKCWNSVEYQMIISLLANDSNSNISFSFSEKKSNFTMKINNKNGFYAALVLVSTIFRYSTTTVCTNARHSGCMSQIVIRLDFP